MRIALVWDASAMRSQQVLSGVCRRAEAQSGMSLRRFDILSPDIEDAVLKPLRAWNPNAVVVRLDEPSTVGLIRKSLPGVPIIAACRMPFELVSTIVVGNAREVVRVTRNHLHEQGVNSLALWAPGAADSAESLTTLFHSVIPNGPFLAYGMTTQQLREEPEGEALEVVGSWLKSLPKPIGIVTFSGYGAPFLSRVCARLGLRVPKDIQLVGCDDADACLDCTPHLTTVIPSGELIGEAALEAALGHLVKSSPPPPQEIHVDHCTLIARGSTGPIKGVARVIAKAADLIQTRATDGLTADMLIRMARQGRSTFYEQFRDATGSSPGKKLRERRIAAACRLLVSSGLNITAISEKCGYSSANYFSSAFRKEMGMSPVDYRRRFADSGDTDADANEV